MTAHGKDHPREGFWEPSRPPMSMSGRVFHLIQLTELNPKQVISSAFATAKDQVRPGKL